MTTPAIRGLLVNGALAWMRGAFGDAFVRRCMDTLAYEDRAHLEGLILPITAVPLAAWQRFLDACHEDLARNNGPVSTEVFDRRMITEAGSTVLELFFRTIMSLLRPSVSLGRLPFMHTRGYAGSSAEVLENRDGYNRTRYRGDAAMVRHFRRYLGPMSAHIAEVSGGRNARAAVVREDVLGGEFVLEVVVTYSD